MHGEPEATSSAAPTVGARDDARLARLLRALNGALHGSGQDFFDALASGLCRVLGVQVAALSVADAEEGHLRTVAVAMNGEPLPPMRYAAAGTPCEQVLRACRALEVLEGAQRRYPDDAVLRDLSLGYYLCVPILESTGDVAGLLAVGHPDAPSCAALCEEVLTFIAPRVISELERARAVAEAEEQRARYQDLYESASEASIIIDADNGIIVDANRAARALFGAERGELVGRRIVTLSPPTQPDGRDSVQSGRAFSQQADALGEARFEWMHQCINGEPLPVTVLLSTFTSGERPLYRAWLHDRRRQLAVEAKLEGVVRQAERDSDLRRVAEMVRIGLIVGRFSDVGSFVLEYMSSAAESVVGRFAHDNVLHLDHILRDTHPEDRLLFGDTWMRALTDPAPVDLELRLRRDDGSWQVVWLASTALDDGEGSHRWFHLVRDVSQAREAENQVRELLADVGRAERDLRVSNRRLRAANAELEAFTYAVSHDLRAPVRRIDGFATLLAEEHGGSLDETGLEFLERIRSSGRDMRELIDALLRLSRIHRQAVEPEPIDLSVLVQRYADHHPSPVDWHIQKNVVVLGDGQLLRAALVNLLDNAVKYSAGVESPTVWFGTEERAGRTCVIVRDNGVGFDESFSHKLFRPFERLHRASDFEGHGIGLATVKRIFDLHDALYGAESPPGEGATFWFRLPPARRAASAQDASA